MNHFSNSRVKPLTLQDVDMLAIASQDVIDAVASDLLIEDPAPEPQAQSEDASPEKQKESTRSA